jgi:hypothetical protein
MNRWLEGGMRERKREREREKDNESEKWEIKTDTGMKEIKSRASD